MYVSLLHNKADQRRWQRGRSVVAPHVGPARVHPRRAWALGSGHMPPPLRSAPGPGHGPFAHAVRPSLCKSPDQTLRERTWEASTCLGGGLRACASQRQAVSPVALALRGRDIVLDVRPVRKPARGD